MQFHDKRSEKGPVPVGLHRLVGVLVAHQYRLVNAPLTEAGALPADHYRNSHISVADHDPKTGLSVPHLQLNFEPELLDAAFIAEWKRLFGTTLRSELLENTSWKRYAWGVWEE